MLLAIDHYLINVDHVVRVTEVVESNSDNQYGTAPLAERAGIYVTLTDDKQVFFAGMTCADFQNLANGDPY